MVINRNRPFLKSNLKSHTLLVGLFSSCALTRHVASETSDVSATDPLTLPPLGWTAKSAIGLKVQNEQCASTKATSGLRKLTFSTSRRNRRFGSKGRSNSFSIAARPRDSLRVVDRQISASSV